MKTSRFTDSQILAILKAAEDRDKLEIVVRVQEGSSEYVANLFEQFNEIARSTIDKMDSKSIVIVLVTGALIWGSNVAWKLWLDQQAHIKEVESKVTFSKLEKEKLQVFADALTKDPHIKNFKEGADEFRNDSVHKLKPNDSFTVPDSNVAVDGSYASKITHTPRERSIEVRMHDVFAIQSVV